MSTPTQQGIKRKVTSLDDEMEILYAVDKAKLSKTQIVKHACTALF